MKSLVFLILILVLISAGCGNKEEVKIGSQVWMLKNLDVGKFKNGDPIPEAKTNAEWIKAGNNKQPAWCYYENNVSNGEKYGKLYNWYAVNDPRGLAPEGWHIPSDKEWNELTDYLEGITKENKLDTIPKNWCVELVGGKLKATTLWKSPNEGATNSSDFTAFPGGNRNFFGNYYCIIGQDGVFWSSSEFNDDYVWNRLLSHDNSDLLRNINSKESGLSVRCIRDY